jgi:hypothetical protein
VLQGTLDSKLDSSQMVHDLYADMQSANALWEGDDDFALVTLNQVVKEQRAQMARLAEDARIVFECLK